MTKNVKCIDRHSIVSGQEQRKNDTEDYSAAIRTGPLGRKLTNRNANWEQKKATFFHKLTNNVEGSSQYISK